MEKFDYPEIRLSGLELVPRSPDNRASTVYVLLEITEELYEYKNSMNISNIYSIYIYVLCPTIFQYHKYLVHKKCCFRSTDFTLRKTHTVYSAV